MRPCIAVVFLTQMTCQSQKAPFWPFQSTQARSNCAIPHRRCALVAQITPAAHADSALDRLNNEFALRQIQDQNDRIIQQNARIERQLIDDERARRMNALLRSCKNDEAVAMMLIFGN